MNKPETLEVPRKRLDGEDMDMHAYVEGHTEGQKSRITMERKILAAEIIIVFTGIFFLFGFLVWIQFFPQEEIITDIDMEKCEEIGGRYSANWDNEVKAYQIRCQGSQGELFNYTYYGGYLYKN